MANSGRLFLRRIAAKLNPASLWMHKPGVVGEVDPNLRRGTIAGAGRLFGVRQADVTKTGTLAGGGRLSGTSELLRAGEISASGALVGEGRLSGVGQLVGGVAPPPIEVVHTPSQLPHVEPKRRRAKRRVVSSRTRIVVGVTAKIRAARKHEAGVMARSRTTVVRRDPEPPPPPPARLPRPPAPLPRLRVSHHSRVRVGVHQDARRRRPAPGRSPLTVRSSTSLTRGNDDELVVLALAAYLSRL
jgi:hypothetical protein